MNEQLHNLSALKQTTLSEKERVALREDIVSFMEANPVASYEGGSTSSLGRRVKSEFPTRSSLDVVRNSSAARHHTYEANASVNTLKRKRMIALIAGIMFALSGGVSFAAQSSLPGDTLYPVKIHVNENIESALAVGAQADAEVARKHLERRAEEAVQLSAEHRLNAQVKAELGANVETHAEAYKNAEATLIHEGKSAAALEVKSQMQTVVEAHHDTLIDLGVTVDLTNKSDPTLEQNGAVKTDASGTTQTDVGSTTGSGEVNGDIETKSDIKIEFPPILPVSTGVQGAGSLKVGL